MTKTGKMYLDLYHLKNGSESDQILESAGRERQAIKGKRMGKLQSTTLPPLRLTEIICIQSWRVLYQKQRKKKNGKEMSLLSLYYAARTSFSKGTACADSVKDGSDLSLIVLGRTPSRSYHIEAIRSSPYEAH